MSSDFVKIYPGFFEGSLRDTPPFARLLFLAMIAKADLDGVALGTPGFWAAYVGTTVENINEALQILSSPDPESTTPDCDGRRIEKWGDGANRWRIINYPKYRAKHKDEDRRDYKREWDRQNAETRHKSGSKRENPTKPDRPDVKEKKKKEKERKGVFLILEKMGLLEHKNLVDAATLYEKHRKENRWAQIKDTTADQKAGEWAGFSASEIEAALRSAVSNGWRGVFPKRGDGPQETTYERV